ncbi:hypothetical protein V8G54_014940 [Vigna mungo]|uniref:Uncharacterized protein n=1 Tax=Vigna mungo TaxID=3915 RepID=A0AAQ3NHK7_VIGMU
METLDSAPSTPARTIDSEHQTPSPLPPSVLRLWRPQAQRNLRNQWSQLASFKNRWFSASSAARSHATALVNFHLSQRDMVGIVSDMINVSRSMKCFFKGSSSSPLLQFSYNSADQSDFGDAGDGGGIPRLLVLEFMSTGYDTSEVKELHWSTQLYDDEFKDLRDCNLYCEGTHGPIPPSFRDGKSDITSLRFDNQPNPEILQVYNPTFVFEFFLHLRFKYIKLIYFHHLATALRSGNLN